MRQACLAVSESATRATMRSPSMPIFALCLAACATQTQWPEQPSADACAAGALPDEEVVLRIKQEKVRAALVWPGNTAGPRDVVVNLHEFRSEPRRQNHYSGWVSYAREAGVVLAGPDGRFATWNAGTCCGKAAERRIDDVGYLDELVSRIDATGCTSGKVLATGIGNGAMMAHRWACESDVVDGIVSVGGALQLENCAGTRPIPVLHFHGAEDTFYPSEGAETLRPVEHALEQWRIRNKAQGEPVVETVGQVTCRTWTGEAPVRSCIIEGMESSWPGAADTSIQGDTPMADATRGAFEWIRAHW